MKNKKKKDLCNKVSDEIMKNDKKGLDTIVIHSPNNVSLFTLKEQSNNKKSH
ncbi:Uncharacterised protein [uncultured Clostridium sp.]|nr:Uncharacterised protein [uncultured Clostridium sp.]